MKIYSKFHDYYDGVQPYDSSSQIIYKRHQISVENFPFQDIDLPYVRHTNAWQERYLCGKILFCGRAYSFWRVEEKCCYSPKEVISQLRRVSPQLNYDIDIISGKTPSKRWYELSPKTWKSYLAETNLNPGNEIHIKYDCPVMVYLEGGWEGKNELILNPRLSEYKFQKIMDPFTCYQEIEMFLGNDLAKQIDPNIHISDELKAQSKGFDKWSFRRPPQKKKRGRR